MDTPFWRKKRLNQLTRQEWESLCDGCGQCCVIRLEDEESGDIAVTNLACRLFDTSVCACTRYARRAELVPACAVLTPERVTEFSWLPETCAYRLVADGEDLPWWHHLVSGSMSTVHEAGVSVRGKVISETEVAEEDWEDHIVDGFDDGDDDDDASSRG